MTRANSHGQQASGIEAKGWPQERKVVKSISIPLSDTIPGLDLVKGSGDVITIDGITDMDDASPFTEVCVSVLNHLHISHAKKQMQVDCLWRHP